MQTAYVTNYCESHREHSLQLANSNLKIDSDFTSTQHLWNMHCCLQISEITAQICAELVCRDLGCLDTFAGRVDHDHYPATLAALARTCHALEEPALDALWKTQSSLIPLILCMPEDLWSDARSGYLVGIWPLKLVDCF